MSDEFDSNLVLAENDPWSDSAKKLLGLLDTPAYLRRAYRVRSAVNSLYKRCDENRTQMLDGVRFRLKAWLQAEQRDPSAARAASHERERLIGELIATLFPEGAEAAKYGKPARPDVALRELRDSVARFNRRWSKYLDTVQVDAVNEIIDGYNRHYLIEKECAFRSARAARQGFVPMEKLTAESLLGEFPLLPEP